MSELYDDLCAFTPPMWNLLRYRLGDLSRYLPTEAAEPAVVAQKVVTLCNTHSSVKRHIDFVRGAFSRRSNDRAGWLAHRHEIEQELRVLGVQAGEGDTYLNLDDLYIELDVVRSGITMSDVDECGGPFGHLRPDSMQPEEERDQTTLAGALERLADHRRGHRGISLIGEPGSGKSTLLKKLWCTAYQRCKDDPNQPVPLLLPCATLQHLGVAGLKPRDLRRLADFLSTNDGFY
ncbi:MAG TPA: NACHT domain-containing protein, partial [Myxococcota bacterium]|nr:NACHT domain-containing protein [Myxococcota bacterium]